MNKQPIKDGKGAGIEWTHIHGRPGFTANPVRGCLHDCEWRMPDGTIVACYAKEFRERLDGPGSFEKLTWHPDVLEAVRRHKQPAGIFIDSMSDLFGQSVDAQWILDTLRCIRDCPQHVFFSLTKNPSRLPKFSPFPSNLWLGISAPPTFMYGKELSLDQQRTWFRVALEKLAQCSHESKAGIRWLSLEPLSFDMSDILREHLNAFDWAVIGAGSDGARKFQPDRITFRNVFNVLSQSGKDVFLKGNIDRALANDICGGWLECWPSVTLDPELKN